MAKRQKMDAAPAGGESGETKPGGLNHEEFRRVIDEADRQSGLASEYAGSAGKVATADFTFTLPLEGLVDKGAERTRLQNEIKKVRSDVDFSEKRLGNPGFVSRAKPELVEQEKANLAAAKEKLGVLEAALAKL